MCGAGAGPLTAIWYCLILHLRSCSCSSVLNIARPRSTTSMTDIKPAKLAISCASLPIRLSGEGGNGVRRETDFRTEGAKSDGGDACLCLHYHVFSSPDQHCRPPFPAFLPVRHSRQHQQMSPRCAAGYCTYILRCSALHWHCISLL